MEDRRPSCRCRPGQCPAGLMQVPQLSVYGNHGNLLPHRCQARANDTLHSKLCCDTTTWKGLSGEQDHTLHPGRMEGSPRKPRQTPDYGLLDTNFLLGSFQPRESAWSRVRNRQGSDLAPGGWQGWLKFFNVLEISSRSVFPTQWTWVWVNSGSWWWTGRPGVLRFMGSQRVGHDWATELN